MKYLILLFLITGCGKSLSDFIQMNKPKFKKANTNPIFLPFIESFQAEFNLQVNVPIVLGSTDQRYAGVCTSYTNGYREITINKTLWDNFTDEQKEQLVYHELGHCVLNKQHDNTLRENCPNSIMRSYMFSTYEINECYLPEYNHYMENLGR